MDLEEMVRDAVINGDIAPNGGSKRFSNSQWLCILRNNLLQINKDLRIIGWAIACLMAVIIYMLWILINIIE